MTALRRDADDTAPIVILDRAEDVAALPADGGPGLGAQAQDYLRGQGITDQATWAAFRLGQIDAATLARFGYGGKRQLHATHGISIPSWDPRDPYTIAGIIRQNYGCNVNRFTTAPVGIAGPLSLVEEPRIVLVTAPLTALRLHQAGVHDVALVEDPEVLVPLRDWLATRALVLAVHKQREITAMRAALGPVGATAPTVVLSMSPDQLGASARSLLGVDTLERTPPPPITPLLLREVHELARRQLDADHAREALRTLGATTPDLVHAYGLGVLPSDLRHILPREARRAFAGMRLSTSVIAPAYDDQGLIVDLLIMQTHPSHRSIGGCFDRPHGLLAPAISRGTEHVIVTDTFAWLARLFAQGYRNVVLMRGTTDAVTNAPRLLTAGVRRVTLRARMHIGAMARVLRAAGLTVDEVRGKIDEVEGQDAPASVVAVNQPPATVRPSAPVLPPVGEAGPPPVPAVPVVLAPTPPVGAAPVARPAPDSGVRTPVPSGAAVAPSLAIAFVEEDRAASVALYEVGPARYAVELRDDGDTRRRVTVRAHGQSIQDRFDLASPVQRDRFASNAARRTGLPASAISTHLAAVLAAMQAREEAQHRAPTVAVADADRRAAEAFLDHPDLLAQIAADCTALGWAGEARAQALLYLTALSRSLPEPLWAVYRAQAGATPWQALGCIAALVPPEDRIVLHHISDARLGSLDPRSLRHRLVCIDRAEALRPEAALALRILHERGGLGWATATTGDAPEPGSSPSEARGPVAVLAAAAGDLDIRCRDSFLAIPVDESPDQTARILAAQSRRHVGAVPPDAASILRRHHAAQRILGQVPVVIPFADRIVFPATSVRHREEHAWFLGLVATLAFLRQRQRTRSPAGAVLACEADAADAIALTDGLLGASRAGISAHAQRLLATLVMRRVADFTMADLAGLIPDGTRYTFRAALQDLCDFGHVVAGARTTSGRGRLRTYTVQAQGHGPVTGIRVRPADAAIIDPAEAVPATLAVVGGSGFANETPAVACG